MLRAGAAVCPQKSPSYQPQLGGEAPGGEAKSSPSPWSLPGQGPWLVPPQPVPLVGSSEVRVGLLPGAWQPGRLWGGCWSLHGGTNVSWLPVVPIVIGACPQGLRCSLPSLSTLQAQLVPHLNKTIIKTIRLSQLLNHLIPKSIPWVI